MDTVMGAKHDGKKYWTLKHTIETDNFAADEGPEKPWQGILVLLGESTYGWLYKFNKKDKIDHDPNAMAVVYEKDLFETEEEALKEYRTRCAKYAKHLKQQYEFYIEESQC